MENHFVTTISEIFKILSSNINLSNLNNKILIGEDKNNQLLELTKNKINTPIGNILPLLFDNKSCLHDSAVDISKLTKLVKVLSVPQSIVRLDHIGFCYKVDSGPEEKERLIKLIRQTSFYLYEEPSNDSGQWLFVGNTDRWEDPLIEFVPVETTDDKWKNNWLPHVQIDINTSLTADEIIVHVSSIYGKSIKPYLIIIEGVAYIVRCRLGIIDGVNINLDLATKSRNVESLRKNTWLKVFV